MNEGWTCPVCRTVNAPWRATCAGEHNEHPMLRTAREIASDYYEKKAAEITEKMLGPHWPKPKLPPFPGP